MTTLLNEVALINGRRIATGRHGEGVPVLLLHGTPAHSIIWRNVVPRLTAAGLHVHVFDLLGFGASEFPREADTSVVAQSQLIAELLDHWGLPQIHLVGHDIGGVSALLFALEHPQRLHSLTIADAPSYDSWPSPAWRGIHEQFADHARMAADEHRALMARQMAMAVFDKNLMQGALLEAYLAPISGVIGQPAFYQHQVAHYDSRYTRDFEQRLVTLNLPVQILWGAEDEWQPLDYAHRLHRDIPGAVLHVVEKAGHFLMEDAPEQVSDYLLGFIRQARPT
ncbi:alpha/beta fold hydrolase [Pseudomonas sp. CCM 7891]|uniref:Alpha/beta fold hydrolase n=1 Tax=Pseudomonas karstica TaxID=1055468 RepID=A0A7X2RQ75_9PSED|nr:alpha/beta fold hydrolase [Pseudomonas karstica]MTD18964.1 alpha/beta fold hydrolase [Pseudomonas karstica]